MAHARFNVLHVCGSNIGLSRFYDYPVHVLNWDNFDERNPDLQSVAGETDKVVAGGIPHKRLHRLDESELAIVANEAVGDMRQGVMLAGGCGIGALVPHPPREAVVSVARSLT